MRMRTSWLLAVLVGVACAPRPEPPVVDPPPARRALGALVTDGAGHPIAGAEVDFGPVRTRTNAEGYGVVDLDIPQTYVVTVTADGWLPFTRAYAVDGATADLDVALAPRPPPRPTAAHTLRYRGHLANLWDTEGRIIWTPALPGASPAVRLEWLHAIAAAGGTHVPIGPFTPGPVYPGVAWDNPDWTADAPAIRALVETILSVPAADGAGLRPVVFLDSGGDDPRPRLSAFMPVARDALEGLWDSVLVVPTGWEPVVGAWRSADVSWALEWWQTLAPQSLVAYHGSPARLVGSSNPVEPDDPWQGGEADFYRSHGGQYIDIALYQTPHGRELYEDCDVETDACWLNRWRDYVVRIGGGFHGWRVLPIVLFESCAYEAFRGQVTAAECRQVAARAERVCVTANVDCGFGNGLP